MAKNVLPVKIGNKYKPFVIAEISANHNKSIKRVFRLIDEAKIAGASAIKIQSYKAETLTLNIKSKNFYINNKKSLWKNNYMFDVYKKGSMPWDWTKQIFDYAKKKKIICFSTPFDETAVDMLEKVNCPIYKIASFELTDFILLSKVAKTKKPLILSTGMASFKEIKDSYNFLRLNGCKEISLLKCTSTYPANYSDLNLSTIKDMKKNFKCNIGYSDHSLGISAAVTAVSLGAQIVEKHFTLNKNDGGLDSKFSADPKELKDLVRNCNQAWISIGNIKYGPTKNEKISKKKRRSLFFIKNLQKGHIIKREDFGSFRPALGIETKHYKKIINKKLIKNVKFGTPIKKNHYK